MKKYLFMMMVAVVALLIGACSDDAPNKEDGGGEIVVPQVNINLSAAEVAINEDLNEFSVDYFNAYAQCLDNLTYIEVDDQGRQITHRNMAISPLSTAFVLSILANSTDAESAAEITSALRVSNLLALNNLNVKLLNALPCQNDFTTFKLANSIWYDVQYALNPDYSQSMVSTYQAQIFPFNSDNLGRKVSAWFSEFFGNDNHTMIAVAQPMHVINAMSFASKWQSEFKKSATTEKQFFGADFTSTVKMMYQSELSATYAFDDRVEMLAIPFNAMNNEMLIIMPLEGHSISDACSAMTASRLDNLLATASHGLFNVSLPRFEISKDNNEGCAALRLMGCDLETLNLDAAGIDDHIPFGLHQQVMLSVDEQGAKVEAHTDTGMLTSPGSYDFTVNRPFIFMIRNTVTGSIIAAGRICNL
ncbi:MAG: serpin family protein [Muribaculaceae bacterium]